MGYLPMEPFPKKFAYWKIFLVVYVALFIHTCVGKLIDSAMERARAEQVICD